jgi:hypothetical protein
MDANLAANVAWCLLGAVMVGATLTYACLHRLVSQAYEEGRKDPLGPVPTGVKAVRETPLEERPTPSPEPSTTSAA